MPEYIIKVSEDDAGMRLDLFLLKFFSESQTGFSRTHIQKLITGGKVSCAGNTLSRQHIKVKALDQLRVSMEEEKEPGLLAEDIPLEVVYDDQDVAVINKPAGLVVHPAPGNYEHTLANALLYRFGELSDINPVRPGIVHRLDKDTSGLLLVAKNNFSHLRLAKDFASHSIKRKYIALVKGCVEFDENIIELPIGRHPVRRQDMAVGFGDNTRYARTKYRTLKRTQELSLLELEPFTGRTHQLRVHLAFLGHPILGDVKYGKNNQFSRLALHALFLGFIHPRTRKYLEFSSVIPEEFLSAVTQNKS